MTCYNPGFRDTIHINMGHICEERGWSLGAVSDKLSNERKEESGKAQRDLGAWQLQRGNSRMPPVLTSSELGSTARTDKHGDYRWRPCEPQWFIATK